jgi:REP element-mobilizing transposase RayT
MRQARIVVPAEEGPGVYHAVTRTVNGERLFDDVAKEVLRKQLGQIADYCGVEILTCAILSNHFHVLVRVPQKTEIPDAELLRRYQVLYPKPTRHQTARLEVIQTQLASNGPEAVVWRRRQTALMGNLSQFMKLLKQRFSIWFNKSHRRFGTLWAERFKSHLVESKPEVLEIMAAYLDLNCVRAGLADDPKDYRFCGYAEAVAGSAIAQRGLAAAFGTTTQSWPEVHARYRLLLFGTGAGSREHGRVISPEEFQQVIAAGGKLPLATVLRCRVRYFTDGAVLGSQAFVATQLARYRKRAGPCAHTAPRPLPGLTDWGDLATMRKLRGPVFGIGL